MLQQHTSDNEALGRFEMFLAFAVSTVVLVRAFLIVTGYPKVGGGGLHIAHVLWGGLLMGAAIVVALVSPGSRSSARAAKLGGIGFGLFIDEVGKFLTKNTNYFFKPAIAIIYITFVGFYLVVRELLMHRPVTDTQRVAGASLAVTDLALQQLDVSRRRTALAQLQEVRRPHPLADALQTALNSEPAAVKSIEGRLTVGRDWLAGGMQRLIGHPRFSVGLNVVLGVQLVATIGQLALLVWHPAAGSSHGSDVTLRAAEGSAAAGALLAVAAAVALRLLGRAHGLRMLFRSVLVSVLVTQVFVFAEYQAAGIVGLVVELVVLALLRLSGDAEPGLFRP